MPAQLYTLLDRLEARGGAADSMEAQRLHRNVRARLLDETVPETRIDRYVVSRRLGVGGMGVVYAARDAELDREVAIKLVRSTSAPDHDVDQQRLLVEARALAQLSHPNVVSIYDVGMHGGRVFIAMELVRGKTLRQWMTEPRTWQAIVEVYAQAAAGLAAAHRAGLVHRDFKPDNTLIDDADGRVRVVDFGLALGHDSEAPNGAMTISGLDDGRSTTALTASGKVVGTPAYMAPEQFVGTRADARSDQFSFCVSLWEALFGERPWDRPASQRGVGPAAWVLRAPQHPERAPAWLREVVGRGLAFAPAQRWPSMDALVKACRRPPRSWRRWLAVLGICVTATGGMLGVRAWQQARARDACDANASAIASTWDATTSAAIADAFGGTALPHATITAQKVGARLEAFATELAEIDRRTCTAHRVEASLDDTTRSRRDACIDEQRERLATVRELFEQPDRDLVSDAVRIAFTMPPTDRCEDDARLAAASRPGAAGSAAASLRRRIARARQLAIAGRHADALARATAAVDEAEAIDDPVLEAEARIALGDAHTGAGNYDEAAAMYEQAYFAAAPLFADEVALTAAIELVAVVGARLARFDDGLGWVRHAEALLDRVGGTRDRYAADLAAHTAAVLRGSGDVAGARAAYERSIALRSAHAGAEHPSVATTMLELASLESENLHFSEALRLLEDAESIVVATHGEDALAVVPIPNTRCIIEVRRGAYEAALPHCRRALAIRELRLDPDHPLIASSMSNLSAVLASVGDIEGARTMLERAIQIRRVRLGPQHPALAMSLSNLGVNDMHASDYEAALAHLGEALQIRRATLPAGHFEIATTLINLAEVALQRKEWTAAHDQCAEAAAMLDPEGDDEFLRIRGRALACMGGALIELDDRPAAVVALEAAMLTPHATVGDPASRCEVPLLLARALRPDALARAKTVALQARPACVEAGERGAPALTEVDEILHE
jgi:tetratricopeptide (TPR) repeat protein/predicted Ser/Thr protein kinase